MFSIRKLLLAAAAATIAAVTLAGPASAGGICDQQGIRVKKDGVWHKYVVVVERTGWGQVLSIKKYDCGPGNAF